VDARGPLATQVEQTLTHSPLSVVLNSSVSSVPSAWRQMVFGGLRFSVPAQWTVGHGTGWGGCPGNIAPNVLELNTAQNVFAPSCAPPPETAGYLAADRGMVLASGPETAPAPADATCVSRNMLRIC